MKKEFKINAFDKLDENNLYCEYRQFELQKDDIQTYKDLEE